ncbi:MAG TPA: M20/M25/M40 family metallo-hydrolase [Longimicrobiales bacterium]|nr:M20/M25/M40 family metallo-hydrolase [Longimicrobiales bacterium]
MRPFVSAGAVALVTSLQIAGAALPWGSSHLAAQTSSADYTEPYQQKALEIYRTIIGFRTAEGHGQVPAMAEYLAGVFREGGFPAEDVHVFPHTSESGEAVAAVVVRYPGDGSAGRDPILLTAHMDVVDALPEDWERDPFTLVEEGGYFFGRGTTDDKYGVALLTATFLRLKAEGFVPTRDLVIGFTGDEETGMVSTRALVDEHRALTEAEFALNADAGGGDYDEDGRPVSYAVQTGEKTYATFEITVTNPGGHSSTPRTDNAIYELATALGAIRAHRFPARINDATRTYLAMSAELREGEVAEAMRRFAADPTDEWAAEVLRHEPDLVGVTRTTCVATMLRAGHAENALPQSAVATVNCRIWPGVDPAEIQATLQRVVGEGAAVALLGEPGSAPPSPVRDDVMEAVRAGVDAMHPGTPVIPYQAPYATDGYRFRAAGIPTYGIMGLFMKPSDQFAHGLNERVEVRSFFRGLEFWKAVIGELAGRPVT